MVGLKNVKDSEENLGQHCGIVAGPVVVESAQLEVIGHIVEPVFFQIGKSLRQTGTVSM